MKSLLSVGATLVCTCVVFVGCHRKGTKDYGKQYYSNITSITTSNKDGQIAVSHYWRELSDGDYLFGAPSTDSIASWEGLCEERNPSNQVDLHYLKGEYKSINQYVTFSDLVELWYHSDSRKLNDDLTLWRLAQYSTGSHAYQSEAERFAALKGIMDNVCDFDAQTQWDLNFRCGIEADLVEFYERVLARTAADSAAPEIAAALRDEQRKWEAYHALLDSSYRIITCRPDGMDGSAAPMSFAGIMADDAQARATSLEDYYFTAADGELGYFPAKYRNVPISMVDYGRRQFMSTFIHQDPEDHFPLIARITALEEEFHAWRRWMESRDKVSFLLSGNVKDVYDNATNNLRRHKLIMLNNQYEGYGIISDEIYDRLTKYDIDDDALGALVPFDVRWQAHLDSLSSSRATH